jgi:hypothetical protein
LTRTGQVVASGSARLPGWGAARRPVPRAGGIALRLAGAGLLAAMAGIHVKLYTIGYREIHLIGPLFMANGVSGSLACLAVLASPRRWLALVSGGSALLAGGTLGGLVVALTAGLFNFHESLKAPYVVVTIVVESLAFLALAALAALGLRPELRPRS